MNDKAPDSEPLRDVTQRDLRDLRRGVVVNYIGYLLKTLHPLLFVLVVRAYGAESFGLFLVAQAVLLFMARFCVVGLDKGLLWWIPRQAPEQRKRGLRPIVVLTGVSSAAVSLAIVLFSEPLLRLFGSDHTAVMALRVMTLGLLPMVWTDVLVHAVMARRHMKAQVIVKETVEPIVLVLTALALHLAGIGQMGLAVAFPIAQLVAVVVAWILFQRDYRDIPRPHDEPLLPPRELFRYSIPMWFSEMANSFLLRMDVYFVAAYTDLRIIGIYGVVKQFGNTIRSIRRSFDPIVLAIVSEIGAHHDSRRLTAGYSYATFLVTATQLPVFIFLIAFTAWLMPLFGEGFELGTNAVLILCAFWLVNSAANLAGVVVAAYGYARLSLANVLGTIAVQATTLYLLVDRWGLEGAALAVGLAYNVLSIAQLIQMRVITGGWNYRPGILIPLGLGAIAAVPLAIVLTNDRWSGSLEARIIAIVLFAIIYGGGTFLLWRWKRLPGQERRPPASDNDDQSASASRP